MEFLIVLAILLIVAFFVSTPLRRERTIGHDGAQRTQPEGVAATEELSDLEAAREAKYREIRDAELDHRTGKLSDDDFAALDRSLRSEAIEILRALELVQTRARATISER
jgi:hypothetical protein